MNVFLYLNVREFMFLSFTYTSLPTLRISRGFYTLVNMNMQMTSGQKLMTRFRIKRRLGLLFGFDEA